MSDTTTISISAAAFAVLRHRNWTGLSLAQLLDTGRVPLIVRELGSPHPEFLDFTADEALGEVALVEEIPARREVVREVQVAAKAIIEGDQVLHDGVELFTAIMLADAHDADLAAVRLAEMAASVDQLSRKIAADLMVNPAVSQLADPESLTD